MDTEQLRTGLAAAFGLWPGWLYAFTPSAVGCHVPCAHTDEAGESWVVTVAEAPSATVCVGSTASVW